MIVKDLIIHYKGFWSCDSKCGMKIIRDDREGQVTVSLTELPDNPGTSVTNMIEQLATMVYIKFLKDTPIERITWIEHYPKTSSGEIFDKVIMDWDGQKFSNPRWERIP